MWHSTASAPSQLECWMTACAEIWTSGPLGTVLGGVQENPDVIPRQKVPLPVTGSEPSCNIQFLEPPASISREAPSSVQHFLHTHGRYQQTDWLTDRLTDRQTDDRQTTSVAIGCIWLVLQCGLTVITRHWASTSVYSVIFRVHVPNPSVWTKWNGARSRCIDFIAGERSLRRHAQCAYAACGRHVVGLADYHWALPCISIALP